MNSKGQIMVEYVLTTSILFFSLYGVYQIFLKAISIYFNRIVEMVCLPIP
ncbi:MAG: hypothetical protein AABY84_08165 [Candidatus Firestonebacteria bacterium]